MLLREPDKELSRLSLYRTKLICYVLQQLHQNEQQQRHCSGTVAKLCAVVCVSSTAATCKHITNQPSSCNAFRLERDKHSTATVYTCSVYSVWMHINTRFTHHVWPECGSSTVPYIGSSHKNAHRTNTCICLYIVRVLTV
jgi:hypothetical protein